MFLNIVKDGRVIEGKVIPIDASTSPYPLPTVGFSSFGLSLGALCPSPAGLSLASVSEKTCNDISTKPADSYTDPGVLKLAQTFFISF